MHLDLRYYLSLGMPSPKRSKSLDEEIDQGSRRDLARCGHLVLECVASRGASFSAACGRYYLNEDGNVGN